MYYPTASTTAFTLFPILLSTPCIIRICQSLGPFIGSIKELLKVSYITNSFDIWPHVMDMILEAGPKVFDRVEIWRIGGLICISVPFSTY